ncbi:N-6 DNA methylase [Streptomyces kaniharaensis]|uniref:site-specific DNA-methyltransferase (adenine-specific) n=1 Tax=Streptomyces kaniharaensis TaxID=212423 RepID=A0A6N7L4P3_9ACTN|nr:N-6 DNA methylase [Streptomyces kaniharaensis]MQS17254.1 N-6 DNA methylase [Streptomyces kaniharaensis]
MSSSAALSPRACERLIADLTGEIGAKAAVSWAHAAALVKHAAAHGLVAALRQGSAGPDHTRRVLGALASSHPALEPLADPQVVPLWESPISPAGWELVARLWNAAPIGDDGHRIDGYRLGDAYQALSADARKSRALCQTPPWVAELLLDLSLEPALDDVGADHVRMIDPACGTGHILLSALHRVRAYRPRGRAPYAGATVERSLERALQAVHGVDLDPYAAALTRYRLLATTAGILGGPIAAVPAGWPVQVAAADALLDTDEPLLQPGRYHAVVGNPPYITVRDPQVREQIRRAYPQVCSGKYSLALPFTVLMTNLARPAGTIAQLTANSFMKREFGKKYIEQYLSRLDLTWVIDTSGAYIPGHGTPTLIMVHRARPPQGDTVIAIRGNRGEPGVPEDPSQGLVWRAIEEAVHQRLALDRLRRGFETHRRGDDPLSDIS